MAGAAGYRRRLDRLRQRGEPGDQRDRAETGGRRASSCLRRPAPAANYVPYTIAGRLILVAGQMPFRGRPGRGHRPARRRGQPRAGAGGRAAVRAQPSGAGQGRLRRRSRPARPLPQARRLRRLHGRVHRSSGGRQRRLRSDRPGDGRRRGTMRALQSAARACRAMLRSRSRRSLSSPERQRGDRRGGALEVKLVQGIDAARAGPTGTPASAPISRS